MPSSYYEALNQLWLYGPQHLGVLCGSESLFLKWRTELSDCQSLDLPSRVMARLQLVKTIRPRRCDQSPGGQSLCDQYEVGRQLRNGCDLYAYF